MNIAFVGAWGYGNLGDNTYPHVYSRHLLGHQLHFHNSDLPACMTGDLDLLVIGGGGVVYNTSDDPSREIGPHFKKMKWYLDHAMAKGIPFGFLSCGFQFRADFNQRKLESLELWKPYLKSALFASFRSPACLDLFKQLSARQDGHFYPDLGYLNLPHPRHEVSLKLPSRYVVIVPALCFIPESPQLKRQLAHFESAGLTPVWLQMGADCDDGRHFEWLEKHQPNALMIRGSTCEDAAAVIRDAQHVITGRYHGMIYARAHAVPFTVPTSVPHKVESEDWTASPTQAWGHLELLRTALHTLKCR